MEEQYTLKFVFEIICSKVEEFVPLLLICLLMQKVFDLSLSIACPRWAGSYSKVEGSQDQLYLSGGAEILALLLDII